jgi:AP endonuclease-2
MARSEGHVYLWVSASRFISPSHMCRKGWNTRISARESNYGTRIDYILLTPGLLPWFKCGDILPALKGSDHCPVYVELHDQIQDDSGNLVRLFERIERVPTPRISSKHWPEFSDNQKLLSSFLRSKDIGTRTRETAVRQDEPPLVVLEEKRGSDSPLSTGSRKRTYSEDVASSEKKKSRLGQSRIDVMFGSSQESAATASIPVSMSHVDSQPPEDYVEQDFKLALELAKELEGSPAESRQTAVKAQKGWSTLFAPIPPPRCNVHQEPCKELTTTKQGPNKGKNFWICSRYVSNVLARMKLVLRNAHRPLGPGYDAGKAKRSREDVDAQYRCDFFKWSSDVKKDALRKSKDAPENR